MILPLDWNYLGHETYVADLEQLQELARIAKPHMGKKYIVEVGSWVGSSAWAMSNELSVDRIYCIDHLVGSPDGDSMGDRLGAISRDVGPNHVFNVFCQNVREHLMSRIIPLTGTSEKYAANWPFPVSMVFLDGDHEKCQQDIDFWLPHVSRHGGILAGHDFGTYAAVDEAARKLALTYPVKIKGGLWWTVLDK